MTDKEIIAELAPRVRLKDWEIKAIQACFKKHFLPDDKLWLFGSRTNLQARGGDIDLYLETALLTAEQAGHARNRFWMDLQDCLGEQKIDIVVHRTASTVVLDIYGVARQEGVRLV